MLPATFSFSGFRMESILIIGMVLIIYYNMKVMASIKNMINSIKQKVIVGKAGKIELPETELPEGILVEVIVLVEPSAEEDETTYLLKSEANKKQLMRALDNVKQENLIFVDLDDYENRL
jgi:antitoxin YefM